MSELSWGVFATAFGWIVATDFRGAAHRLHALSRAAGPFGGAPTASIGLLRLVAAVFAVAGPFVLVSGLLDLWHGEKGPGALPSFPAWFVAVEALIAGVFLWTMWRPSGPLRREWAGATRVGRAAVAVLTVSFVAFLVTLAAGWGTGVGVSWLVGGLCGVALLLGRRTGTASGGGPEAPGRADS
ncbi:hypothetical protein [Streptomyces sp. NPDC056549]|uniref:hypothetical protein n=1 Tax=Streptomyces sp. NPDC056549 TaxID=3345864 RepID=UPI0036822F01